jgi:hypothetical protein
MRIRNLVIACGLVAGLCFTSASTLNASTADTSTANQVVSDITAATSTSDVILASQATTDSDSAAVVSTGGATVDVPKDPSTGIDVTTSDGTAINIGIANDDSARDAKTTASGTTVYNDPTSSSAVAVQVMTNGVRELFTLNNTDAPTDFSAPLNLPENAGLIANDEGGFDIVTSNADGPALTQATISTPWATDANGRSLTTSYTLDGTTLTQHIDTTGAVFPVVADPKITWGWTSFTVYYDKRETGIMALEGQVLSYVPNPWARWGGRTIATWAAYALATNQCIKIKYYGYAAPWPGYYKGGYCKW